MLAYKVTTLKDLVEYASHFNKPVAVWAEIGPQFARELLSLRSQHKRQRPVSRAALNRLVQEMKSGRFCANGETIIANRELLLDGQHRMLAVTIAEVVLDFLVVFGVPSEYMNTYDTGTKRSAAHVLAINGEANVNCLAATLTEIHRIKMGVHESCYYGPAEVEKFLDMYPNARISVVKGRNVNRLVRPALMCALHYLFAEVDQDDADEFVRLLATGDGLGGNCPVYILRNKLIANSFARKKMTREQVINYMFKVWNAWRTGVTIQFLRCIEGEQLPKLL